MAPARVCSPALILLAAVPARGGDEQHEAEEDKAEARKALARRWFDELINERRVHARLAPTTRPEPHERGRPHRQLAFAHRATLRAPAVSSK